MSKIEELIQQYCLDGVEYKKISDIADTFIGLATSVTKWKRSEGVLLLHNSDIAQNRLAIKKYEYLDPVFVNRQPGKILHEGDIITVHTGDVGTSAIITKEYAGSIGFTTISSRLKNCKEVSRKYFCHYLNSNVCKTDIAYMTISDRSNLNLSSFDSLLIPLPPLPVQEEIVRILDALTELQAELQKELEAELQARQKQYQYYRDKLLSFNNLNRGGQNEVEWKKLGDIGTEWYRGAGIKKDEVRQEGMPCIRYGEIHTTYNVWFDKCVSHTDESLQQSKKYAEYGDILFAITSEDIPMIGNSVAYLGKEKILVGGDIVVMKHNLNPRYLSYALSTTDAVIQKGKGKVKSKVVHTNVPSLKEIIIPIPSLEEQERIVAILDRFDSLVNDLSKGLPAEIEARKQQYEYYRDKLLDFKRR